MVRNFTVNINTFANNVHCVIWPDQGVRVQGEWGSLPLLMRPTGPDGLQPPARGKYLKDKKKV